MKYLGIDFGLRHLGLAMADGPLAEPLGEKKYKTELEAINFLARVCREKSIDSIVMGLPEGRLAKTIKRFAEKLTVTINKPVIFQDETLSTIEAKQKLLAAGVKQKKRRQDHRASAALILEDYLDNINI